MGIHQNAVSLHWNYFTALEDDLIALSRWIEPAQGNFSTYSLELARLLMTTCAEVDVVSKLLCKAFNPDSNPKNIIQYRTQLMESIKDITEHSLSAPKFGLTFHPWENWKEEGKKLGWWDANNSIKHLRTENFHKATLKNVLNAVAALFYLLLMYEFHTTTIQNNWNFKVPSKLFLETSFTIRVNDHLMYFSHKDD